MLTPILMTPAYRCGAMTPWGGRGLEKLGKKVPDDHTGESLEVSVLPGLESCGESGETLSVLLEKYGEELRGTGVGEEFPLLLKFISSEDRLSVQVHPDDAYARTNEGGKLGKTEAWVILDAPQDGAIVYGIAPGVDREALAAACEKGGEALQSCLRFVPVKAGDVFNVPAGTVHALLKGLTVMEIQQSSDVTYRFYDWDRVDGNGRSRELHIKKGLDVARFDSAGEAVTPVREGDTLHYIDGKAFGLEKWLVSGEKALAATPECFRIICPLDDMTLAWEDGLIELHRGDTVVLPAMMCDAVLQGNGGVLCCRPGV